VIPENVIVTTDKHLNDDERKRVIGAAIRARRRELGLSLRDVSQRSGLSIGFLSLVERGLSSFALTSLSNIAKALDMRLSSFFPNEDVQEQTTRMEEAREGDDKKQKVNSPAYVCRADDNNQLTIISSQRLYKMLSPRVSGLVLEPMFVTIQPGETKDEPYGHEGEEFAYVLSGNLLFSIEGIEYRLGSGDSIHLRASVPHTMYNDSKQPAQAIWVLTPRIM
jgi:transcriptional regulator with XRE-family HTH domain